MLFTPALALGNQGRETDMFKAIKEFFVAPNSPVVEEKSKAPPKPKPTPPPIKPALRADERQKTLDERIKEQGG
jgi:hypothetical protein